MSRLTIIGVIVLMSISLLGVVGLQLYWISDAIRVKQEQFDRSVHEALARVVEKLETREAVSAVANGVAILQQPAQNEEILLPTEQPAQQATPSLPEKKAIPSVTASKQAAADNQTSHSLKGEVKIGGGVRGYAYQPSQNQKRVISVRGVDADSLLRALSRNSKPADPLRLSQLPRLTITRSVTYDSLLAKGVRSEGIGSIRIRHLTDSAVFQHRQLNGKPVRFSLDTLQYLALHMDSILRHKDISNIIHPSEIAAINLHRDSLIILRKSPLTATATFRSVDPPAQNRTRQEFSLTYTSKSPEAKASAATLQPKTPKQESTKAPGTQAPAPSPAKLEAKKDKLIDVAEKMVVEYVSKELPLEKRLNLQNLKPLLQNELEQKGISLDFGYWVLAGQQDTVAVSHIVPNETHQFTTYKASLFPNDIFEKPDHLAVYFPDSQAYALQSLWMMLLFSGAFTMVIVATFGTTIYIIFKQKKLSDMKNDFINNMTHEFKTPIATISLATDSIANPRVYGNPEKIKYYTDIIRQENKRMNVQVENVLQIAQLEKNDFKMNLQPVDLHALVVKAVESIKLQVEERYGQINAQLNALQHELRLDEVHAYNVICNLLDNANKYSPANPDIKLETLNVEGGVLLAVEDKGMGMTRDTQLRVFEKFYRVPTGNLHNVKGFGLGLSYVKAIVKAHNGSIRLQSEPGRGSRFEIFLPFSA